MQPTHCSSWQQKRAKMRSKLSTWSTIYGVISVPSTTARRGVSDVMGAAAVVSDVMGAAAVVSDVMGAAAVAYACET